MQHTAGTLDVSSALTLTSGAYGLAGGTIRGGTITATAGVKLLADAAAAPGTSTLQ